MLMGVDSDAADADAATSCGEVMIMSVAHVATTSELAARMFEPQWPLGHIRQSWRPLRPCLL